jgi:glycosyltransferase involved in cell wall biosynthesis
MDTAISVCVSTRNRAHLWPRLMNALKSQTLSPAEFEVVVVDDGSTDSTTDVLSRLAATSGLRMTVLRNDHSRGAAAGRNRAWRQAVGGLVAFTDDDCVPTPDWLDRHLEGLRHYDIVQGRVDPDPSQLVDLGPFSRIVGVPDENGLYETCNISYRREWLETIGGFDEGYRWAGEDADLAWRAKGAGAVSGFVSSALVYHDVEPSSWRRALRDTRRWSGVIRLVEKYPHLRTRFGEGRWRPAHRPAVIAALGVSACLIGVVAPNRRLLALGLTATLPYVRYRGKQAPEGSSVVNRLALIGRFFAVDVAEILVFWSTRARLRTGAFARVPLRSGPR